MQIPLELSFHNMDKSPSAEAEVRRKVDKLERYFERIVGCRVVVEAPHRHHRKGRHYAVRIEISVPGDKILVDRQGPKDQAHQDLHVAIRDAFNAAYRRLEDYARVTRNDVKTHEVPLHGTVRALDEDHGFIDTSDGQEIYFHRNSVTDGRFEDLKPGSEVRVVLAFDESASGPQASTVKPIGKHHLVG